MLWWVYCFFDLGGYETCDYCAVYWLGGVCCGEVDYQCFLFGGFPEGFCLEFVAVVEAHCVGSWYKVCEPVYAVCAWVCAGYHAVP